MVITDIKIRKMFNDKPMKAIASVTLDGQLAVHDIKVISAREKFFIVMPSRKNPDGTYRDIVHPINSAFRAEIESAVIRAYQDACEAQAQSENEGASSESEAQGEADENNGEKSESET
ncbi:MAG: septation regulator SpoVG [Eubacteriales bacterium]|jgi:stage V sporulation protein G|nr:septation regulator SpoVG [Clostridiales bacterium]